jgi:large subunit ribosomal protein L24
MGWKELGRKKPWEWHYDENRPWTDEFRRNNLPHVKHPKIYVEPIKEWKMFKGDVVEIQVGKDKGKRGLINCIIKERNWCFVEGLNCEYRLIPQRKGMPPLCQKDERPLLVTSQVKLVDPSDDKSTDTEWRFTQEGERVRVSVRTGRIIPLPSAAKTTEDFVLPSTYIEGPKDTKTKELTDVTFEPKLKSFEQDIMDSMGIKEERTNAPTYWY